MEKSKIIFENSQEFMKGKKKNLFLLLLIPAVVVILFETLNAISQELIKVNLALGIIALLIVVIVFVIRFIIDVTTPFALINYLDTAHEGKILSPVDSYKIGWNRVLWGFVLLMLKALIVFVGMIAFIVPGIYLALLLGFADYVYIIKKKGVKASLVYSSHIMQGNIKQFILMSLYIVWKILLFLIPVLVSVFVLFVSVISLVGKLYLIPLAIIAFVGVLYFGVRLIKTGLVAQDYMYGVFKEIEKTKGEITEKALESSKKKLKKIIRISALVAVAVSVLSVIIFLSVQ